MKTTFVELQSILKHSIFRDHAYIILQNPRWIFSKLPQTSVQVWRITGERKMLHKQLLNFSTKYYNRTLFVSAAVQILK